jgi:branched-chain amino acid transport system ATP-binding protein
VTTKDTALLSVQDVVAGYNGTSVLHGITFEIRRGEVIGVLGPNGAGKTTLLRTIGGLLRPSSGRLVFDGRDVTRVKPYERSRLGLVLIPERGGTFAPLTVEENLRARWPRPDEAAVKSVLEMFPGLATHWRQQAGTLSGGERQMLSLARAYAAKPTLLLVDEISIGLAPKVVKICFDYLVELKRLGISVIVVDQYVDRLAEICDRLLVVARGELVYSGQDMKGDAESVWRYFLT